MGVHCVVVFPAQMTRLIAAGNTAQAPIALALNTSIMYLGFSIGSSLGAVVLGTGAIWGIGSLAAVAELAAFSLNVVMHRRAALQVRS